MTAGPGLGGTPDKQPGYTPPDQPGVAAGSSTIIRARKVIIVGTNGELLIYNPTVANGNLVVSASGVVGTGLAGDTVQAGVTAYAVGGFPFTQLTAGQIQAQATSGQFAPAIIETAGVAGELALTSGLATNVDNPANVIVDSSAASGIGVSLISLQASSVTTTGNMTVTGTLSVNGSTSTGSSGLPDGTIHGTSGAASAGTAHTHGPGSFAVGNGVHVHVL